MTLPVSLSSTALDTLAKCGQQYYYRYVQGLKVPPGVAMVVGTSVDDAATQNLQSKIVTGEMLPLGEVQEIADSRIRREFSRGVTLQEEDGGEDQALGNAADRAVRMATTHALGLAPVLDATAVQRGWELVIPAESITLTGIIDVEEAGGLRDLKTSAKSPPADAAETSVQLTAYALARNRIDGIPEPTVKLDYIVQTGPGREAVLKPPLVSRRNESDFNTLLLRVERAASVIRAGAFTPARPDEWFCSAKWCGYYASICPFVRRPVSVPVASPGDK